MHRANKAHHECGIEAWLAVDDRIRITESNIRRQPVSACGSKELIPPFPQGKAGAGMVPATSRHVPRQTAGTAHAALPNRCVSVLHYMSAWNGHEERIKDGRHVGLDFYDLLIEAIFADIVPRCCSRRAPDSCAHNLDADSFRVQNVKTRVEIVRWLGAALLEGCRYCISAEVPDTDGEMVHYARRVLVVERHYD